MSIAEKVFDFVDSFHEKLSGSKNFRNLLAGVLGLIIIFSLLTVYYSVGKKPQRLTGPTELHYFCLDSEKEFVIKPDFSKPETMMEQMDPMGGMLAMSPYTNQRTAVPMTQCPECKKWFVPEYLKTMDPRKGTPATQMGMGKQVCPFCQTDILDWYRRHRKKR
jgi:hypothetical protein